MSIAMKIASLLLLSVFLATTGCDKSETPEGGGTAGEQTQQQDKPQQ